MASNAGYPQPVGPQQVGFLGDAPSAPPLDGMDLPPGYESATFVPAPLPPPPPPDYSLIQYQDQKVAEVTPFTEKDVRDALAEFVEDNCCYGSKPVRDMHIKDIIMIPAFHYKLETFTERRETCWAFEPYEGQPVDTAQNGQPPGPWQVYVPPSEPFEDRDGKYEVPHTAFVRMCHKCTGAGHEICKKCDGQGRTRCFSCHGSGRKESLRRMSDGHCHTKRCFACSGSGLKACHTCHSTGQVKCNTCLGFGQLKCFVQLKVYWKNNIGEFVLEETDLPDELIKDVNGTVIFDERYPRVQPLARFPDQRVLKASQDLVQKHASSFNLERIIEQRHNVQLVPVAVIKYQYKSKHGEFFMYGLEHKVYFPEYPSTCSCSIL